MTNITRRSALAGLTAAASLPLHRCTRFRADRDKVECGGIAVHIAFGVVRCVRTGHFADAGFDVDFTFFQAAQPMAVAVASKDVDFAVTAISGGLVSLAQKDAARVIAGALREEEGRGRAEISRLRRRLSGRCHDAERARWKDIRRHAGRLILPLHGLENGKGRRHHDGVHAAAKGGRNYRRAQVGAGGCVVHSTPHRQAIGRLWGGAYRG